LDITDNLSPGGKVEPPEASSSMTATTPTWWWRPTRARPPSPTSPTASPRTTASGSANAFASGGSVGYDHKVMGITARGAWEAVKRHFREMGKDIQSEPFTVVGCGDMSGDVFGNGMLLSRQDPAAGGVRPPPHRSSTPIRTRPRATDPSASAMFGPAALLLDDYNRKKISRASGVRAFAESIPLTAGIRALLGPRPKRLSPSEVIQP
jgi:glutamate dehydrogenase